MYWCVMYVATITLTADVIADVGDGGYVPPNSRDICNMDPPDTSARKTPGDNGFRIKFADKHLFKYKPNHDYTGWY